MINQQVTLNNNKNYVANFLIKSRVKNLFVTLRCNRIIININNISLLDQTEVRF